MWKEWPCVERSNVRTQLDRLQRLESTAITGGMRTAPMRTLSVFGSSHKDGIHKGSIYAHYGLITRFARTERCPILLMSSDHMPRRLQPSNFLKVVITEREEWSCPGDRPRWI